MVFVICGCVLIGVCKWLVVRCSSLCAAAFCLLHDVRKLVCGCCMFIFLFFFVALCVLRVCVVVACLLFVALCVVCSGLRFVFTGCCLLCDVWCV